MKIRMGMVAGRIWGIIFAGLALLAVADAQHIVNVLGITGKYALGAVAVIGGLQLLLREICHLSNPDGTLAQAAWLNKKNTAALGDPYKGVN